MNGTLMFGGDRFGPDQDYAATYRSLGGSRLAPEVVQAAIPACYEVMERIYNDPARCDSFPRVLDTLRTLPQAKGLDERELKLLEDVIARHERGQVPDSYAIALRSLARSHPLGFVGDNLRCDIGGAAGAGLATVWLDPAGAGRRDGDPQPDFVVRDLLELV